jgi:hypothetical protein
MGDIRMPKSTEWKILRKKTCGKTRTEMGRHQEGLIVAAECKGMEETNRA